MPRTRFTDLVGCAELAAAVSEAGGLRSSRDVPVAGRVGSAPVNAVGHYNRTDVFRLTVDGRPRRRVDWLQADGAAERVETR